MGRRTTIDHALQFPNPSLRECLASTSLRVSLRYIQPNNRYLRGHGCPRGVRTELKGLPVPRL